MMVYHVIYQISHQYEISLSINQTLGTISPKQLTSAGASVTYKCNWQVQPTSAGASVTYKCNRQMRPTSATDK